MFKTVTRVILVCSVIWGSLFFLSGHMPSLDSFAQARNQAAVVTATETPVQEVKKTRVFIMPGHEPNFGGSQYKNIIERDLNVAIAADLGNFLVDDGQFEVVLGRSADEWNPQLQEYFDAHWDEIEAWRKEHADLMKAQVEKGEIELVDDHMAHGVVSDDVATRLYGVNKWLGENNFDLAIHIHVNDYGSRSKTREGEFTGYVIYIPETQYANSAAAKSIATSLSEKLSQFFPQSNAKREKGGVIEDQELVALGRYGTLTIPSMLVEYAYVYESQFQDKEVRKAALREYAYQTYLAMKNYFDTSEKSDETEVSILPYSWENNVSELMTQNVDVFALQIFLRKQGLYPTESKTFNDCPITGLFGACTKNALTAFQEKNGITGEEGVLGAKTREKLNAMQ